MGNFLALTFSSIMANLQLIKEENYELKFFVYFYKTAPKNAD